ncbi:hypothetical protein CULT_1960003 [[Clostridium] ultunense Esp]|nr:hypothetical protein CULT_1960003 [[Clostridium] ultunense Esp]
MEEHLLRCIDESQTIQNLIVLRQKGLDDYRSTITDRWMSHSDFKQLGEFHRHLYKRVIEITLRELEIEGKIPKKFKPFSFVLLGSGGREELTSASDQDHMMIIQGTDEMDEEEELFYAHFTQRIAVSMVQIGLPLCEGNVLATNRKWRLLEGELRLQLDEWFYDHDWKQVRNFIILYDMNSVYGDVEIVDRIRQYIYRKLEQSPFFLKRIFENMKKNEVPITPFGKIMISMYGPHQGSISVKQGMYLPLVKSIRLISIGEQIHANSTLSRIQHLVDQGFWDENTGNYWSFTFLKIMTLRYGMPIRFAMKDDDHLPYSHLAAREQGEIKEILRSLKDLQKEAESYVKHKLGERR